MEALHATTEQPPARIVAGALAHLARHMETGCQRSAYLAAMLLEKVAADPEADDHLRCHARELVEILDRDGDRDARSGPHHDAAPVVSGHPTAERKAANVPMGAF